ncbi:hypothetical protein [Streptomyces sp. NPDC001450]
MESPDATSGQLVDIDLHPQRVGRCYLTAWDSFGLVGEMPIVALSMAALLRWLLRLGGGNPMDHLPDLGDAYDSLWRHRTDHGYPDQPRQAVSSIR